MTAIDVDPRIVRRRSLIAHSIIHGSAILWQVLTAVTALYCGTALMTLLQGLGARVGPAVMLFLVTSRWWMIVPIVSACFSIAAMKRLESQRRFAMTVLTVEILVGLLLNIWMGAAFFGQIFSLSRQAG